MPDRPRDDWDIEVSRATQDLSWRAYGAVALTIEFKDDATPPEDYPDHVLWAPAPPAIHGIPGPGYIECTLPRHMMAAAGHFIHYKATIVYPNGGTYVIDPEVIIQP